MSVCVSVWLSVQKRNNYWVLIINWRNLAWLCVESNSRTDCILVTSELDLSPQELFSYSWIRKLSTTRKRGYWSEFNAVLRGIVYLTKCIVRWPSGDIGIERRTCAQEVTGSTPGLALPRNNLGQVIHTHMPLSPSGITDHPPTGVVYNFGHVYVSVCLSVCLSVRMHVCQTITFESLDVGSSYLHKRHISRYYGSSSYIKVNVSTQKVENS